MTRFRLAGFAFLVLAASAPGVAQTLPPPALIRTAYVSVAGTDTVWQNIIRTPASFQSDILIATVGASVKVTALLDQSALIRRLDVEVWRGVGSPNQVHSQAASFAVTDDSVVGEVRSVDRRQPQRFPSPTGAMIIQGNYLGFLEQLVLRARALGKTEASIPLFFFGTPGLTALATVRLPTRSDSAIVSFRDRSTELRVDELGRIVAGKNGPAIISRVKFREIFPSEPPEPTRCGNATRAARQALSHSALATVFTHYGVTAADVANARALNDTTDSNACRDMLTLIRVGTEGPALFKVGNLYVAISGADPKQKGAAVVYADNLEVARLIPLGK